MAAADEESSIKVGDVAIVGHGPSMLTSKHGVAIDACDVVVRLKRCQDTLQYPELYGTRTDIVGGSFTVARALKGIGAASRYWIFLDSRHVKVTPRDQAELRAFFSPARVEMDAELCWTWDETYRRQRRAFAIHPQMKQSEHSDLSLGHNHTSIGMKALIYACHFIQPERVRLFGFDNLASGTFTWSVTRGPAWNQYPDHRWDVEHDLVPMIAQSFGSEIIYT